MGVLLVAARVAFRLPVAPSLFRNAATIASQGQILSPARHSWSEVATILKRHRVWQLEIPKALDRCHLKIARFLFAILCLSLALHDFPKVNEVTIIRMTPRMAVGDPKVPDRCHLKMHHVQVFLDF